MVTRPAPTRLITAAVALLLAGIAPLSAGDFDDAPRRHLHGRGHDHRQDIVGGAGLPSVVPGIGTFAGSVSAARVRGNGIYFAVEGSRSDVVSYRPPVAKIIEVEAEMEDSACSYEAGVCVIRLR